MTTTLTTRQRVQRMYEHRDADRVPIIDDPWGATLARWRREGLPADVDWAEYLGLDRFVSIRADNSPRYPRQTIEETDDYIITKTEWGATIKNWKKHGGVPEFMDFTITDPDAWAKTKARMTPDRDRIDWAALEKNYPQWQKSGAWITAGFWFGFDITHSWLVGTERVLMSLVEDPQWIVDIFNHCLDVHIALFEQVWEAGYRFDAITWPDDMGYKGTQFFSLDTYRQLLRPVHQRAAEWAHAKGVKVRLHSCGNINPFIPDLIDIGIDMLNPLEVKAGMNPPELKKKYGGKLAFHGGLNAALFWEMDKLEAQMRDFIPKMKEHGGYIISSDHSVPDSVSLAQFKQFIALAKELSAY